MSAKGLFLVSTCVVLIGAGQLLFKSAANQWRVERGIWVALGSLLSVPFVTALIVYGFATLLWVYALRTVPLGIAFPLYALTFVLVPVLAYAFLGEPLTWRTLVGAAIIILGVTVSVA